MPKRTFEDLFRPEENPDIEKVVRTNEQNND